MGRFIIMSLLLITLSGCMFNQPSYMTIKDAQDLHELKSFALRQSYNKDIRYQILLSPPESLAKNAAEDNDFRPIGLAMGYHAEENDAKPLGIECNKPIETKNIVFGCFPPPEVYFKLMFEYNKTLISQPNFPSEYQCRISAEVEKYLSELKINEK